MKKNSVSLIRKLGVLIIDFNIYQGFLGILYVSNNSLSAWYREEPILFALLFYLIYFVLSEYLFHRTLAMWIFGVSIPHIRKKEKNKFLKYSLLVFLDRNLFLIVYIFRVLFSINNPLLISERYSGLKWKR